MEFKLKYLIANAAIVLILYVQTARSIKCWECQSSQDKNCLDPFNNATFAIADCNNRKPVSNQANRPILCQKIRTKNDGVWTITRRCVDYGEPGTEGDITNCKTELYQNRTIVEYCTCKDKDGCNTSSRVGLTMFLIAISSVPFIFRAA